MGILEHHSLLMDYSTVNSMITILMYVMFTITAICLLAHWSMVRKLGAWSSLPGPWTPLVFVFELLCNSNTAIVCRDISKRYQKAGLCHIPLTNIPLIFVGDFKLMKFLWNHPDVQGRVPIPDGPLFQFLLDYRSQGEA